MLVSGCHLPCWVTFSVTLLPFYCHLSALESRPSLQLSVKCTTKYPRRRHVGLGLPLALFSRFIVTVLSFYWHFNVTVLAQYCHFVVFFIVTLLSLHCHCIVTFALESRPSLPLIWSAQQSASIHFYCHLYCHFIVTLLLWSRGLDWHCQSSAQQSTRGTTCWFTCPVWSLSLSFYCRFIVTLWPL
jgi:hypothetical protein